MDQQSTDRARLEPTTDRSAWIDRLATGAALLAVLGLIALAPIA